MTVGAATSSPKASAPKSSPKASKPAKATPKAAKPVEKAKALDKTPADKGTVEAKREINANTEANRKAELNREVTAKDEVAKKGIAQQAAVTQANADKPIKSQLNFGSTSIDGVTGPVELQARNAGLHLDGSQFSYQFQPLGADGKVQPSWTGPDGGWKNGSIAAGPLGTSSFTMTPPYDNPNGWRLNVNVPGGQTYNGNSAGFFANYYQR